jgi:glucuronoarabinoxylan endo-1,4-beta-xylanase
MRTTGLNKTSPNRTSDRRYRIGIILIFAGALVLGLALIHVFLGGPVTVNWNIPHQTIDGFGASATGYTGSFAPAQADKFFSAATGLGLSLLRIDLIPDTVDADCGCVANNTPYTCVSGSKSQIVSGDLQIARLAVARGATLFAAPWSPPAGMKSSGGYCTSGSMIGNPVNYTEYAAALASFPALLKAYGLSIYAMSIQNEPNATDLHYDTCTWTAEQIHDFIPYLSSALSASGFENIKIGIPEESSWKFDLMNRSMNDPAVAAKVGLILGHAYGVKKPSYNPSTNGVAVWQTEVSSFKAYDGSMRDALTWAQYIHNYMSVSVNAWMYWNLDCGPGYFNQKNNMCLTDQNGNTAKRGYVLGQYAKFIRPGWQRIEVTNRSSLMVTAYRGEQNEFAVVAINKSSRPASNQTFVLNGITAQHSQVIPWITSTSASLAPQAPVSLTSNGTIITYTIPANSVVTFHGRGE